MIVLMTDHRDAVPGEHDVQFNSIGAEVEGEVKCLESVFGCIGACTPVRENKRLHWLLRKKTARGTGRQVLSCLPVLDQTR
jgi:hypothetical protein